jgi:hypothetical protein
VSGGQARDFEEQAIEIVNRAVAGGLMGYARPFGWADATLLDSSII